MLVEYFNQNLKFYFPVHSEAAVGVDCCSSAQSLKTFIGGPTDEWRMRDLTSRIGKMFSGASRTFRSSNPSFISLMIRFLFEAKVWPIGTLASLAVLPPGATCKNSHRPTAC